MEINVVRRQGDFLIEAAFEGPETGVTALFGPSGAGKTSVINMVAGLTRPDSGRILMGGLRLFDSDRSVDLPPERRRVGYVFQDGRLLPHLSVRANLAYGLRLTPAKRRFVDFDDVVELLGLRALLERRPARLSGGEKQRVAIGRALLTSPAMLLMDEPLASLDAARKAEVLPFIMRLSREYDIPMLYVSHLLDEILNLADRLVILDSGRVVAAGGLEDILTRPEIRALLSRSGYEPGVSGVIWGSGMSPGVPSKSARFQETQPESPARRSSKSRLIWSASESLARGRSRTRLMNRAKAGGRSRRWTKGRLSRGGAKAARRLDRKESKASRYRS